MHALQRNAARLLLLLASATLLSACVEPQRRPDPAPKDDGSLLDPGDPDAAPDKKETPRVGWVDHAPPGLGLSFQLPTSWQTRDADPMFFANPEPPGDDVVAIFLRADGDDLQPAIARLDAAFPLRDIHYREQQRETQVNGLQVTYGEGEGWSEDFNSQLRFIILHIPAKPNDLLFAAYVRADAFAQRKPQLLQIIESLRTTP